MSILRPGDEKFHYSDGSHRWTPPDLDYDQEVWEEQVRQHKQGTSGTSAPRSVSSGLSDASSTAAKYSNRASRTKPRSAPTGPMTSHRARPSQFAGNP